MTHLRVADMGQETNKTPVIFEESGTCFVATPNPPRMPWDPVGATFTNLRYRTEWVLNGKHQKARYSKRGGRLRCHTSKYPKSLCLQKSREGWKREPCLSRGQNEGSDLRKVASNGFQCLLCHALMDPAEPLGWEHQLADVWDLEGAIMDRPSPRLWGSTYVMALNIAEFVMEFLAGRK